MTAIRNPAPVVAGGRALKPVLAERLDGSKDTRILDSVQRALPAGFDPVAMPMLARHWFGVGRPLPLRTEKAAA